ncbi:MAG: T9SS type A sorting domain-containing protein [Rhodothermales bacterium]
MTDFFLRSLGLLALFTLLGVTSQPALAQWERMDRNAGLPDGVPAGLWYDGQTLFTLWTAPSSVVVSLYSSADLGASWSPVAGFTPVAGVPTLQAVVNGRMILAALLGNATAVAFLTSDDGGTTWSYKEQPGLGQPSAIAYGNGRWYLSTASFLYVSTDDMQTWTQSSSGGAGSGVLLTDNAGSLLANRSGLAYRSADDGATWTAIAIPGNFLNFFSGAWQVGTTFYLKNVGDGQVHRSEDGGATWTSYTSFGDFNWANALVAANGETWIPYTTSVGGANFFLSTDAAVTATAAFDLTGYPLSSSATPCFGVPKLAGNYLFISANLCFNDQNGIYRYALATDTAAERTPEHPDALDASPMGLPYPNPARTAVTVPLNLQPGSSARIHMVDLLGRTVRTWTAHPTADRLTLDLSGVPAGMYVLHTGAHARPLVVR